MSKVKEAQSKKIKSEVVEKPKAHFNPSKPRYIDIICDTIIELNEPRGCSRHQISSYICNQYDLDIKDIRLYLNRALVKGVNDGVLKQRQVRLNGRYTVKKNKPVGRLVEKSRKKSQSVKQEPIKKEKTQIKSVKPVKQARKMKSEA